MDLSTAPFAGGWKAGVSLCFTPRRAMVAAQKADVNWTPLSKVTTKGTP
jgi:hypothetical protein